MEYFPRPLTLDESNSLVDRIEAGFELHGFGLCAAQLLHDHSFVGYVGLAVPKFSAHFTPCIEIGWRLAAEYWGRGLATEGAREIVRLAFGPLALHEIVSFTVPANLRSRRIMEKLGMIHDPADDFDHPGLPEGDPLRRHVLYRLRNLEVNDTPGELAQNGPRPALPHREFLS